MIETNVMSIDIETTEGEMLVLIFGDSKNFNVLYSHNHKKQKFMAYTEENRLWCVAERRRLQRMMNVKSAKIIHKTVKS